MKKTFLLIALIFGLAVNFAEATEGKSVRICGLMPNSEVLVKIHDDTIIRKAATDKGGNILIEKLHGNFFIFESTSANGKRFYFEVILTNNDKSGTLLVDCVKLF